MPKSIIKSALKLYQRRKFPEAIRLLESQVFRFRDSFKFYSLLGFSCLYSGDYGGAESYLKRAEQIQPQDTNTLLALAAIHLKRIEIDEALEKWLKVIDNEPGNRIARNGLNILRKGFSSEKITEISDSGKIKKFIPPLPFNPSLLLYSGLIIILAAIILVPVIYLLPRLPEKEARPGIKDITLSVEHPSLVNLKGNYSIILSEEEICLAFESIKDYLLKYRDNLALMEINKIMLSNASSYVKEKANLLRTFVKTPDFTSIKSIKDSFSLQDILKQPSLYQDCSVVWRGKATNINRSPETIRFDFLVGYEDEKQLLGVVPVIFEFAIKIEEGMAVEILGKIDMVNDHFSLKGISIHQLLKK